MLMKNSLVCVVLLLCAASLAVAQFNGAIYTTMSNGATVNQNLYPSKDSVYLNGGPQNTNGPGLPDGYYYYQVTDPSGVSLLSTDNAECRQAQVVNGIMAGAYATPSCHHANGTQSEGNGSVGVQLIPFSDTPNGGGEYKVWLISQAAGCITSIDGLSLQFNNSCAKTDNFKVDNNSGAPPNFVLSGVKYRDTNRDGIFETDEAVLPGWTINLHDSAGAILQSATTDANGAYSFAVAQGTAVRICEVLQTNWIQYGPMTGATAVPFTADANKCWAGTVGSLDTPGLNFGNMNTVRLEGIKFYDTNKDTVQDTTGEPGLPGWTIQLIDPASGNVLDSTVTGPSGGYHFDVDVNSHLKICEVQQSAYFESTTPACYEFTATADRPDLNFGNYIPVAGMKYYDTNKNGLNNSEAGIQGFQIQLGWCDSAICMTENGYPTVVASVTTDASGLWSAVMPPPPATLQPPLWYRACEVLPLPAQYGNWVQTGPTAPITNADGSAYVVGSCWVGQVGSSPSYTDPGKGLDFGNVCVGPKFGHTLGFWSNKNGQALITDGDLASLATLNLRNADGSNFDPASKMTLRSWLLGATATNMANMLSAQMAATFLDVAHLGPGSVQVWFNDGWVSISDAINTANGLLGTGTCGTTCVVLSGNTLRSQMEAYKDLFDSINNNTALIQGCAVTYPK